MVSAEFFDIFGIIVFAIILIFGGIILDKSEKKIFRFIGWILLVIGIIGIAVDGTIVVTTYII